MLLDIVPLLLEPRDLNCFLLVVLMNVINVLGQGDQVAVKRSVLFFSLYESVGDLLETAQTSHRFYPTKCLLDGLQVLLVLVDELDLITILRNNLLQSHL